MKKIYIFTIFLVAAIGMSACSSKQNSQVSKETSESSQVSQKSSTANSASSTPQPSSPKESSTSTSIKEKKWSSGKKQRLSEFMEAWGKEMGQSYTQYDPNHNLNLYGLSLPWSVIDNNSNWKAVLNNQPIDLKWSETGEDNLGYQLVDVYSDMDEKKSFENHVYFFVINSGKPIVLYTSQNQGNANNYLYLIETENNELKNAFARIVG
jgi:hypothetical protein